MNAEAAPPRPPFPVGERGAFVVPIAVAALALGCASWLPAPVPMTAVNDPYSAGKARCLVVFLPGFGDSGQAFVEQGFVKAIRNRGLSADVVAANATSGYYFKGIFSERTSADVVEPARARGYEQTWVMGMSMGGMGSLWYASDHPSQVQGVLSLAPFLGPESLGQEIRAAGGLAGWKAPDPAPKTEDNYQRQIWRWLQAVVTGREPGPEIYLGWGDKDNLGTVDAVLGEALPRDRVFVVPGGHDWPTWSVILEKFLTTSSFARACRAEGG